MLATLALGADDPWFGRHLDQVVAEAKRPEEQLALLEAACASSAVQDAGAMMACDGQSTLITASGAIDPIKGFLTLHVELLATPLLERQSLSLELAEGTTVKFARVNRGRVKISQVGTRLELRPKRPLPAGRRVAIALDLVRPMEGMARPKKSKPRDVVYRSVDDVGARELSAGLLLPTLLTASGQGLPAMQHLDLRWPARWQLLTSGMMLDGGAADTITDTDEVGFPMNWGTFVAGDVRSFGGVFVRNEAYVAQPRRVEQTLIQLQRRPSISHRADQLLDLVDEEVRFHSNLFGPLVTKELDVVLTQGESTEVQAWSDLIWLTLSAEDEQADARALSRQVATLWWGDLVGAEPTLAAELATWSAAAFQEYRGDEVPSDLTSGLPGARDSLGEHRFQRALRDWVVDHRDGVAGRESLIEALQDAARGEVDLAAAMVPATVTRWGVRSAWSELPDRHFDARAEGLPVAWRDVRCQVRWLADLNGVPMAWEIDGCEGPYAPLAEAVAAEPPGVAPGGGTVAYRQDLVIEMAPSWSGLRLGYGTRKKAGELFKAVEVRQLREGTPAANSPLRRGDLILSLDGAPTPRVEDVYEAERSKVAGQVEQIRYQRRGRDLITVLDLVALPKPEALLGQQVGSLDARTWDDKPLPALDHGLLVFFVTTDEAAMLAVKELIPVFLGGVPVVGITEEDRELVHKGFEAYGPPFPVGVDTSGAVTDRFPVYRLPTVLRVEGGEVVQVAHGIEQVRGLLRPLIAALPTPDADSQPPPEP